MLLIGCLVFYKRARVTAGDAAPVLMCTAPRQPKSDPVARTKRDRAKRYWRLGAPLWRPVDHTEECRTALLPLGSVLTRLAVGLGPPSAHGAAGAVRPEVTASRLQRRTNAISDRAENWVPRCPGHSAQALS
jgi:hypothetical protein